MAVQEAFTQALFWICNIEQRTIGYGCRQNQEAKLKIVGGVIPQSNQQLYNICNHVITLSIVLTSK